MLKVNANEVFPYTCTLFSFKSKTTLLACLVFKGREGLFRVILAMLTLGQEEILELDMEGMLKVGTHVVINVYMYGEFFVEQHSRSWSPRSCFLISSAIRL